MSKKMKPLAILVLSFAFCNVFCQNKVEISFDQQSEMVTISGLTLDGSLTNAQVIETMGEPSKKVDYPSGEVSLFYEDKGIVFLTIANTVAGLGINFNSDGDKKFPTTSLNGKLTIGGTDVTKESKQADILAIKEVAFVCPFPLMCASSNRDAKTVTTIAFKDDVLTQVTFLLNE